MLIHFLDWCCSNRSVDDHTNAPTCFGAKEVLSDGAILVEIPADGKNERESGVEEDAVQCALKEQVELDGTWVEFGSGNPLYHLIEEETLTWADGSLSSLDRDPKKPDRVSMTFNGQTTNGVMDESGTKLIWSDGDTWFRASFDGWWEENHNRIEDIVHVIERSHRCGQSSESDSLHRTDSAHAIGSHVEFGSWMDAAAYGEDDNTTIQPTFDLVVTSRSQKEYKFPLTVLTDLSFELVNEGSRHVATLDRTGQLLTWDDGDKWRRVSVPECSIVRQRS
jgi:hypothetical protein